MQTEIRHNWFFTQSPEDVWNYLTKAELVAQWLMPNNFEPVLGHDFEFRTKPIPSLNLNGIFRCKVIEIVPLQKLVYSWKGGPEDGIITLDTIVEWKLELKEKGTQLFLIHSGFKEENESVFAGMLNGWDQNVRKMATQLNAATHADSNT